MMIPHPNFEKGYYIEKKLYEEVLTKLPKRIELDKDCVGVFVGAPGDGKSTLAQQIMYILDKTISIDSIKWTFEEYLYWCDELRKKGKSKGKGIIHDEGRESLSSLSMMSKRTRGFLDYLYQNRSLNMYHFILTGDYFDIPRSIAMQRLTFMINVVEKEGGFENGEFHFYDRVSARKLYMKGKKFRNMKAHPYWFRGSFSKGYTVNERDYRLKKNKELNPEKFLEQITGKRKITLKEVIQVIIKRNPTVKPIEVSRILQCDRTQFFAIRDELKVENEDKNIDGTEAKTENNLLKIDKKEEMPIINS